ncbi:MAG TPA: DUF2382 domain-containing protein [Longimicrobium sp.]|jgi:uncharacterized protein (TIGR02271 family)|uniref:DUF2382 domain-containing protein n=1 Tax=Longimicrobium sp. TaxID=2029185 RepID=UPI002EDB2003
MANEPMDRVVPLNSLPSYKVADGEPDIRGWDVMSADGRRIGRVDDLLVDTGANKVRYVDVEGDRGHMCVPIGLARLERGSRQVMVDRMQADQFSALPTHERGNVTRDYEMQLGRAIDTDFDTRTSNGTNLYGHEGFRDEGAVRLVLSEEELAVGKRQVAAGEVGVSKRVETEHVTDHVALRHDEVDIQRRPITDPMVAGNAQIGAEEIRVPLHAEEAIVEKRVVPKEELVVRTREVVENETIEADLRRERAEVHREGVTERTLTDRPLNDDDRLNNR